METGRKMDVRREDIIRRYLNGTCTDEDIRELETMLSNGIEEAQWMALVEEKEVPDIVPAEKIREEEVWERIHKEIGKMNKGNGVWRRMVAGLAASIVLLAGFFGYQHFALTEIPASEKLLNTSSNTTPEFLVMEDQSEIWINSKSTVRYPSKFSPAKREVTLKGQAFFNVTKEKKRQFIVHAGELDIKVLGTAFDVKSYPEENETVITLLTGKVEVEISGENRQILLPNQQLIFNKTTKMITIHPVRAKNYDRWREGEIIFTNLPLSVIAKGLKRKFNKTFIMDSQLNNRLITLKLNSGGLEEALEILSHTADVSYLIRGETVVIKPRGM